MKRIIFLWAMFASSHALAECADKRMMCLNKRGMKIGKDLYVNAKMTSLFGGCEIMETGGGRSYDVVLKECRLEGGFVLNQYNEW
jgi:hypothetical protein